MLLRRSVLNHPSGVKLRTPLLIPSFSSKGFKTRQAGMTAAKKKKAHRRRAVSEIDRIFRFAADFITDSMLVSAYDIYYGYLPRPDSFEPTPALTIVDSGGYETDAGDDMSAIYRYPCQHNPWKLDMLKQVYDQWPDSIPAIFVNFDRGTRGKPLLHQIRSAKTLFARYPRQLHNFLIKPEKSCDGDLRRTIMNNTDNFGLLSDIHIIGVTEKELGSSILDKMSTITLLRKTLDEAGVNAPIQVFGALDPLSSCLYFISGAEIFDGLTWLRFAYREHLCVYITNHGVLNNGGLSADEDRFKSKIVADNLYYLGDLQLKMGTFVATRDFAHLPHTECLVRAERTLQGIIEGGE